MANNVVGATGEWIVSYTTVWATTMIIRIKSLRESNPLLQKILSDDVTTHFTSFIDLGNNLQLHGLLYLQLHCN